MAQGIETKKYGSSLKMGMFTPKKALALLLAGLRGGPAQAEQGLRPHAPLKVYESLRNFHLTGSAAPVLKDFSGLAAGLSLALTLFGSLALFAILAAGDMLPDLVGEPAYMMEMVVLAGFLLPAVILTLLAVESLLRQLGFLQILTFISVPIASAAGWIGGIAYAGGSDLTAIELLLSSGFCITALLTLHCLLAFVFEWRITWPFHALGSWLASAASSAYRLDAATRLSAWLLFLAPCRDAEAFGWRAGEDYDALIGICAAERDRADWRGLVAPALALFAALNLPALVGLPVFADLSSNLAGYIRTNPLFFAAFYLLAALALCHTLELILSRPASVLINIAAVQARHALVEDPNPKAYAGFRTIDLRYVDAIDAASASWRIVDKVRMKDGSYRCLIEKTTF